MTFKPQNAVHWSEIPVTDLEAGRAFYAQVFQFDLVDMEMGPDKNYVISTADQGGVAGHLYVGKPAGDGTGPTLHLRVPDTVEATMERLKSAGGAEVSPVITIPPGRFAYATDPDGNSLGLFQPAGT